MPQSGNRAQLFPTGFLIVVLAAVWTTGFRPTYAQAAETPSTMSPNDPATQESGTPAPSQSHKEDKIKRSLRFVNERASAIRDLTKKTSDSSQDQSNDIKGTGPAELRAKFEEFTRLADELSESMDDAAPADANTRKLLRTVVQNSAKWPDILNGPPPDRTYDFARKTALDAATSCSKLAQKLLSSQAPPTPPALTTGAPATSPNTN